VYLLPLNAQSTEKRPEIAPKTMWIQDEVSTPTHICIQVGQTLIVRWRKPEIYHLFPEGNRTVAPRHGSILIPGVSDTYSEIFTEADTGIKLKCAGRQRIIAFLSVVPTKYFGQTSVKGEFELPEKAPPGQYLLKTFHPQLRDTQRTVLLRDGTTDFEVNLLLEASEKNE
jgi:hypothetical protein